jgi:hypothetical protein
MRYAGKLFGAWLFLAFLIIPAAALGITVDVLDEGALGSGATPPEVRETITSPQLEGAIFQVDPASLAAVIAEQAPPAPKPLLMKHSRLRTSHAPVN